MNSQNNEDDSMNFSVIDKNEERQPNLDFSVQSLLDEESQTQNNFHPKPPLSQKQLPFLKKVVAHIPAAATKQITLHVQKSCNQGQFLRDLSRMQKQLSFQTELYNIYDQQPSQSLEIVHNNKSKTLSCLKATKEYTNKSITKDICQDYNDYYGDLILDFHKRDHKHKDSKKVKTESRQISNHISSEQSNMSKAKSRKQSKSHHQLKTFFRPIELQTKSKNKVLLAEPKRSKSKSVNNHKFGLSISKSQSHLKTSTEAQTFASKVFTQYYGTDVKFHDRKVQTKKKKEKETLASVKSKQKQSKSKQRLVVLSPRNKLALTALTRKSQR